MDPGFLTASVSDLIRAALQQQGNTKALLIPVPKEEYLELQGCMAKDPRVHSQSCKGTLISYKCSGRALIVLIMGTHGSNNCF